MKRQYSKVKFMTMAQLKVISEENYHRGVNGKDYHDQIDDIKNRLYDLTYKKQEEMIKKRERDYFEQIGNAF